MAGLRRNRRRYPPWVSLTPAFALLVAGIDVATCDRAFAQTPSQATVQLYDIPATPMNEALQTYGRTSNAHLLFSPVLVADRKSHAIKGKYSSDDALRLMLDGSGLAFTRTASNVILITAAPSAATVMPITTPAEAAPVVHPSPPPEDDTGVERIVIISGKRPEYVQNTPASVQVATAGTLENLGIRDFDDIVRLAPSTTISKTSQPANSSINIRGIGTYAYSIATEASTAVVIDDIPQAFQASAFSALVDVQQIEVLRGPQNTLFGKSASAGVISITTQPATDTLTGRLDVMATDDDEHRVQGTISGPINDELKFRLAGNLSRYRGNLYNISTGHWLNGQTDNTLRGKLVWTPGDDWTVTLSPYVTRTVSACCAFAEAYVSPGVTYGKNNIPQSVILAGITPGPDNRVTRMDVDAKANATDYGAGLKIVRVINGFTLASISAYDRYRLDDLQDTDSSDFDFSIVAPGAPVGGSANGGHFKIRSVTQELRLTSPDNGHFSYVAGLWYSDTRSQRYFVRGSNDLGTYNSLSACRRPIPPPIQPICRRRGRPITPFSARRPTG